MDVTPTSFDSPIPLDVWSSVPDTGSVAPLPHRWAAVRRAAAVVAEIAGVSPELAAMEGDLPALVRTAPPGLRDLVDQGVADVAAIMEPGLAALIAVHSGGGDASAPARALWHEFVAARDALLMLAHPRG